MKRSELKQLIREAVRQVMAENIEDFHKDLQGKMAKKMASVKRSDYQEGDEIYTIGGSPVTFISDMLPDRKTGEQMAYVKFRDGSSSSIHLKNLFPEPPTKEIGLNFLAKAYKNYNDFVDAANRRGYDESDGLQQIWDNK